jgi:hypothetical protein
MNGLTEAKAALEELRQFIGKSQLAALRELFRGEERQYFFDLTGQFLLIFQLCLIWKFL